MDRRIIKVNDGICIEMDADVRDIMNGTKYKAFLRPNRTDVFRQFPSQPAALLRDHARLTRLEKSTSKHCERVQEARDVARNGIAAADARKTKNILLRFPAFSSEAFLEA